MTMRFLKTGGQRLGPARRGSSILELIIYLGVFSLIVLAVTRFSLDFLAASAKAAAMQETQRNGRYALARLATEIREADSVTVGSSVFGSNPGTLTLATATADTNPTVFTVTAGVLTVKRGSGATLPLTNSKVQVSNFTLQNLSPNNRTQVIGAQITLTSTDTGGILGTVTQQSFTTTERIRKNDGYSN